MLSNGGSPFNEDGWAAMIADIRRLFLLVGGGTNDLNQASTSVTQDAANTGEDAGNATKFRGFPVATTPPTNGQSMVYSVDHKQWEPGGATGTGLLAANNLSDLTVVATARSNLGLGSAAVLTTTGVLLPANNLSDVTNTGTAKSNIGLGTGNAPTFNALSLTANLIVGSGTQMNGVRFATTVQATNYAALDSDFFIVMSGNTVTLPTVTGRSGKMYVVGCDPGGASTIVSAAGASETVFNATGVTLAANATNMFVADGVNNWYRIS